MPLPKVRPERFPEQKDLESESGRLSPTLYLSPKHQEVSLLWGGMLGTWLSTGVDRLALVAAGLRGAWSMGIWVTWGRADSLFVPVMGWREAGGGGDIPGEI